MATLQLKSTRSVLAKTRSSHNDGDESSYEDDEEYFRDTTKLLDPMSRPRMASSVFQNTRNTFFGNNGIDGESSEEEDGAESQDRGKRTPVTFKSARKIFVTKKRCLKESESSEHSDEEDELQDGQRRGTTRSLIPSRFSHSSSKLVDEPFLGDESSSVEEDVEHSSKIKMVDDIDATETSTRDGTDRGSFDGQFDYESGHDYESTP